MATASTLQDDVLRARGVSVLDEHLGPVEALRFLALISREPFDYQTWRERHFASTSLSEIATAARQLSRPG